MFDRYTFRFKFVLNFLRDRKPIKVKDLPKYVENGLRDEADYLQIPEMIDDQDITEAHAESELDDCVKITLKDGDLYVKKDDIKCVKTIVWHRIDNQQTKVALSLFDLSKHWEKHAFEAFLAISKKRHSEGIPKETAWTKENVMSYLKGVEYISSSRVCGTALVNLILHICKVLGLLT